MQVNFNNIGQYPKNQPSFEAMKKKQFLGVSRIVVEKYKLPIEKFNVIDDMQRWCKDFIDKNLIGRRYPGRQEFSLEQRTAVLKEWFNYVLKENQLYTSAMAMFILAGITKGLKETNDEIPPILNKGVLADTIDTLENSTDKNYNVDFERVYSHNLKNFYATKSHVASDYTGWIEIPSKEKDKEHFEQNVNLLKTFSHPRWCTKSFNAEPYLARGDFHIYLENGEPKVGVRFDGAEIVEIQGELNNSVIPIAYYPEIKEHVASNYFSSPEISEMMEVLEQDYPRFIKFKSRLDSYMDDDNILGVFEALGMNVRRSKNGLILDNLDLSRLEFSFNDLKINSAKLFKNVVEIENHADFSDTDIVAMPNLVKIGGDADFASSKITSLPKLEMIEGFAKFRYSMIEQLPNLKYLGAADFKKTDIISLPELLEISGTAEFTDSRIQELPKLRTIGGDAIFDWTTIKEIPLLESIDGDAVFTNSNIQSLPALVEILGAVDFNNSPMEDEMAHFKTDKFFEEIGGMTDAELKEIQEFDPFKEPNEDDYWEPTFWD